METIQIVINGRTYHVRADSADSFRANMQAEADERAAAVKRADEAEKARDEAVARADAAESERDELKSKVEETETKLTEAEKQRADASDPEKLAKERADHVALVLEVKELKGEAGKVEELVRLDSKALQVELATTLGIDDADKKEPAILAELIAFAKKNRIDAAGAGTQTVATQQTSASVIAQAITQAPAQRADAVKDSPFLSALKERDEARKQKASA